jgi:NAD(P)-dependent dehydrogenase (short-subunit alcohol dehydrogenase family)
MSLVTNRFNQSSEQSQAMLLKPTVLIFGATAQIGRYILEHLNQEPDAVHIRVAVRSQALPRFGDPPRQRSFENL